MILLCELSLVYKPIFLPNSLQAVDHALNCLRPFITMSIPSQPFCCSAEGVCHLSMFFDICCHFSRTPVVPVTYKLTAPHSLQAPLSCPDVFLLPSHSHHLSTEQLSAHPNLFPHSMKAWASSLDPTSKSGVCPPIRRFHPQTPFSRPPSPHYPLTHPP